MHMVIIHVKHKMRLNTTARSAGLPRLPGPLLVQEGTRGVVEPAYRLFSPAPLNEGNESLTHPFNRGVIPVEGMTAARDLSRSSRQPSLGVGREDDDSQQAGEGNKSGSGGGHKIFRPVLSGIPNHGVEVLGGSRGRYFTTGAHHMGLPANLVTAAGGLVDMLGSSFQHVGDGGDIPQDHPVRPQAGACRGFRPRG